MNRIYESSSFQKLTIKYFIIMIELEPLLTAKLSDLKRIVDISKLTSILQEKP